MGLETMNHIADFNVSNPDGSDRGYTVDDHIRGMKTAFKNDFVGFSGSILVTGTNGGSADAYTVTPTTTLLAYSTNHILLWSPTADNTTTTPTINVSSLGAVNLKRVDGTAPVSGEYVSGRIYAHIYNGSEYRQLTVSKQYIDQLIYSAALPAMSTDYLLTYTGSAYAGTASLKAGTIRFVDSSDTTKKIAFDASGITTGTTRTLTAPNASGTMALTTDIKFSLLAPLTPTAAANVDALSTFTSSYDNYLIIGSGLTVSADDILVARFAVAGSVDSGSNYFSSATDTTVTATQTNMVLGTTVTSAGKGASFVMTVMNANDATNLKICKSDQLGQTNATPGYQGRARFHTYSAANAISGIRFFWSSGSNFGATGKIRIYGYNNT